MSELVTYDHDPLGGQKQAFLEALVLLGLNVQAAARSVGWDTRRVNLLREADDDFLIQMDEVREDVVSRVEAKAFSRALAGDPNMVSFVLKHNRPDKYNPAIKVESSEEKVLVLKDFSGNLLHESS